MPQAVGRQGDKETKGVFAMCVYPLVSLSPCLLVPLSPCPLVSLSPRPLVPSLPSQLCHAIMQCLCDAVPRLFTLSLFF
jgi:hypothetical protein